MSFKETVKNYAAKVKAFLAKIVNWFNNHNVIGRVITCVLSGLAGIIITKVLHNGRTDSSAGNDIQSAISSVESARDINQRTESNIDELKSTVGSGQSILEEIRKQKLD